MLKCYDAGQLYFFLSIPISFRFRKQKAKDEQRIIFKWFGKRSKTNIKKFSILGYYASDNLS